MKSLRNVSDNSSQTLYPPKTGRWNNFAHTILNVKSAFLTSLSFIAAASLTPYSVGQTPIRAVPVADFLNTIGANSAISRRGETLRQTTAAVKYIGLGWIRAGYESDIPVSDLILLHNRTGVRFSYGLGSGGTDLQRLLAGGRQLASAHALVAFEGPNEPNNWGVNYKGNDGGGHASSWLAVAALQRDLYKAVKSDAVLKKYPVWDLSENGAEIDNVGLQFLTIPNGAHCSMPDGTRFADAANVHNYIYHSNSPGLDDNKTWNAADPTPACRVDGLYGEYGTTWLHHYAGYSTRQLLTLPRVTTETGTTIGGVVTEEIQALNLMSMYLDQFKRGFSHTSVYLLRDRSDEGGNQAFGFFTQDYTQRKAALYLHNLTTILSTGYAKSVPATLNYAIPDQPETVHDLLLQKKSGTLDLAVWDERVTGSDRIDVRFATPQYSVKVFDPTVGTDTVQVLTKVKSIHLTLSSHPMILEITQR